MVIYRQKGKVHKMYDRCTKVNKMKVKDVLQLVLEDETVNLISKKSYYELGGDCINLTEIDDFMFWNDIANRKVTNIIPDGYDHILVVYGG